MKCQCLKRLRPMNGRNTHTHAHTHKKMTRKIQRRNHRHCELEFIFFVCSECLLLLIFCFMGQLTYATVSIFISTFLSLSLSILSLSLSFVRVHLTPHTKTNLYYSFFFWYATACSVIGPSSVALLCKSNCNCQNSCISVSIDGHASITWWPDVSDPTVSICNAFFSYH